MNVAEPYTAVCPSLDGPVLAVLARTTRPLAAREVERLSRRGSWEGVRRTLNRLAQQGIANVHEAGGATLYELNREHVAADAVLSLMNLREELFRRLQETISGWTIRPRHVSVFGSTARGDGGAASDIDLLLVRPDEVHEDDEQWRQHVGQLGDLVLRWTGNHAAISELSEDDVARLRDEAPRVVSELQEDSVTVFGPSSSELLRKN